jgi:hypothetical protein
MQEFTHRCPDDTHLALTALAQPLSPTVKEGTTAQCGDGWKVECFTQPRVSDL